MQIKKPKGRTNKLPHLNEPLYMGGRRILPPPLHGSQVPYAQRKAKPKRKRR